MMCFIDFFKQSLLKSKLKIYLILLLVLALSSCTISKKIYQVITDPDIAVGDANDRASEVTLSILSDADINLNSNNEPAPLDIAVVYLNEDSKLLSTAYYQIEAQELDKVLGKNYIDHQEYTIDPDQFKVFAPQALDAKTAHIAVIAHYADIDSGEIYWLDVIDVKATGEQYHVLIHLMRDEVVIKKKP